MKLKNGSDLLHQELEIKWFLLAREHHHAYLVAKLCKMLAVIANAKMTPTRYYAWENARKVSKSD